jgi:hypothetical protein
VQRLRLEKRHPIVRLAFTADGTGIVTAQPHTSVAVHDRMTGEARSTFPTEDIARFSELLVHPTREMIAVQCPKWCRVYKLSGSTEPNTFDSPQKYPGIAVTPNGFRMFHTRYDDVLHTTDCGVVTADGGTGTNRIRIRSKAELATVTPDAKFGLALHKMTRPVLLDLTTGRVAAELQSRLRSQNVLAGLAVFAHSPDGSKLAIGNGDSLAVFDLASIQAESSPADSDEEAVRKKKVLYPLFTIDRPDPIAGRGTAADRAAERWLPPLAFDPTGRTLLAVGLRNRVQRIDVATGGVIVEWGWRAEAVRSLAVAPDGLTAAAGCRLGELIVWDLE